MTSRVAAVRAGTVERDDGIRLVSDVVVGTDGATTSAVPAAAGPVNPGAVPWGFAQRGLSPKTSTGRSSPCETEHLGRGSPGYGWLFPGQGALPTSVWGSGYEPTGPLPRER